jgi:hypothetical protein
MTSNAQTDVRRARYRAWKRAHLTESEVEVWLAAWQQGASDTLRLDAQLARDLGQIHQLLERLEQHVKEYAEREVEDGCTYWFTEDEDDPA